MLEEAVNPPRSELPPSELERLRNVVYATTVGS